MDSMTTKRRCPFGDTQGSRQCKMLSIDPCAVQEMYSRTLETLMANAQQEQRPSPFPSPSAFNGLPRQWARCWVCKDAQETSRCSFCEKDTCSLCQRQCERCQDTFCSFCCTTNFDARYDRVFCLTCNEEETKAFGRKGGHLGNWSGDHAVRVGSTK